MNGLTSSSAAVLVVGMGVASVELGWASVELGGATSEDAL